MMVVVIIATLDKLEVGQFGWYYDGCSQCTKSVSLKDGKLRCFLNHDTDELVPMCLFLLLVVYFS